MPVSLIGTFAVMAMMGFTLNNLTLFGLVLAIGIVVDDAIVVLENTERMIAKGYDARTATIRAMDEITGPIMAITLALSSVFVPCCFLGGITGQFFRQFAVTIAVSTIISAVNAMTMTPSRAVLIFKSQEGGHAHKKEALPWWAFAILGGLLSRRLLGGGSTGVGGGAERRPDATVGTAWASWGADGRSTSSPGMVIGGAVGWVIIRPVNAVLGWLFRGFNKVFDVVTAAYGWVVGWTLRLSIVVLLAYGGLLVLTWWVFQRAPTGFIPQQDQGRLIVNVQLPDSASLQRTQEAMATVSRIAREVPGVRHTVTIAGMSFLAQATSSNFGSMFVVLDPFDQAAGENPSWDAEAILAKIAAGIRARG